MFTLFLIGNIASGKSFAARELERRGARRIDLDELAKGLYVPGSLLVTEIAETFGHDVLDADGAVRRAVLASRAFASPEETARLDALVRPALMEQLGHRLLPANCCSVTVPAHPLTVVEVSAPRGFEEAFGLADGVVAITAPLDVRRERAIARGMRADDFDRRAEVQPSENEIAAMADAVIDNTAADDSLMRELDAYLAAHGVELPSPAAPSSSASLIASAPGDASEDAPATPSDPRRNERAHA